MITTSCFCWRTLAGTLLLKGESTRLLGWRLRENVRGPTLKEGDAFKSRLGQKRPVPFSASSDFVLDLLRKQTTTATFEELRPIFQDSNGNAPGAGVWRRKRLEMFLGKLRGHAVIEHILDASERDRFQLSVNMKVAMIAAACDKGELDLAQELFGYCQIPFHPVHKDLFESLLSLSCKLRRVSLAKHYMDLFQVNDATPSPQVVNAIVSLYANKKKIEEMEETFKFLVQSTHAVPSKRCLAHILTCYYETGEIKRAKMMIEWMDDHSLPLSEIAAVIMLDPRALMDNMRSVQTVVAWLHSKGLLISDTLWNKILHAAVRNDEGNVVGQILDAMGSHNVCLNRQGYVALLSLHEKQANASAALSVYSRLEGAGIRPGDECIQSLISALKSAGRSRDCFRIFNTYRRQGHPMSRRLLLSMSEIASEASLPQLAQKYALEACSCSGSVSPVVSCTKVIQLLFKSCTAKEVMKFVQDMLKAGGNIDAVMTSVLVHGLVSARDADSLRLLWDLTDGQFIRTNSYLQTALLSFFAQQKDAAMCEKVIQLCMSTRKTFSSPILKIVLEAYHQLNQPEKGFHAISHFRRERPAADGPHYNILLFGNKKQTWANSELREGRLDFPTLRQLTPARIDDELLGKIYQSMTADNVQLRRSEPASVYMLWSWKRDRVGTQAKQTHHAQ